MLRRRNPPGSVDESARLLSGANADDLYVERITKDFTEKVNVSEDGNPKKKRDDREKPKLDSLFVKSLKRKVERYSGRRVSREGDVFGELEKVGFGAVLEDDELHLVRGSAEKRIRNALAMELLDSDAFTDQVVRACNKSSGARKRMRYTQMFGKGDK